MLIETKQIGKFKIEISLDEFAESPRTWDNLGKMICFHNRYDLGDKHSYRRKDYNSWDELKKDIVRIEGKGITLPLYLYDHSGITMNTTGFSCGWDSGQVGWIHISREKILKEYGGKILTKSLRERVSNYLVNEVDTYDQYLRGEVYEYAILDEEGNSLDSCSGIFGQKNCMVEAENVALTFEAKA